MERNTQNWAEGLRKENLSPQGSLRDPPKGFPARGWGLSIAARTERVRW